MPSNLLAHLQRMAMYGHCISHTYMCVHLREKLLEEQNRHVGGAANHRQTKPDPKPKNEKTWAQLAKEAHTVLHAICYTYTPMTLELNSARQANAKANTEITEYAGFPKSMCDAKVLLGTCHYTLPK